MSLVVSCAMLWVCMYQTLLMTKRVQYMKPFWLDQRITSESGKLMSHSPSDMHGGSTTWYHITANNSTNKNQKRPVEKISSQIGKTAESKIE